MDQTTALPGTIETSDDPRVLRTKSQDFNWFSPVLKAQLEHKSADTVYFPADRHELRDIVRHAFLHERPIVVRGGGTGNYGQCVPLAGGCVIDMARLDRIPEVTDTSVTAEAGIRIDRLQARLHDDGRELRLYPSSLRMSSLGGFLGGGAGGVGSVTWGFLWDPGNVLSARIMTVEAHPRIIDVSGADLALVLHAYGTTGILLDITMPLAPHHPWVETMWAFATMPEAIAFSQALAASPDIFKRDVATIQRGIPSTFKPLAPWLKPDDHIVLASTSATSDAALSELGTRFDAERRFHLSEDDLARLKLRPNYEYGWNHATLNFLRSDRSVTYIQCGYPRGQEIACVTALHAALGDEAMVQLQWIRDGEHIVGAGLNVIRYTTPERLRAIAAVHRDLGIEVSNCHSFQVEMGGPSGEHHHAMARFKAEVDPLHLLNPGKLAAAAAAEPVAPALVPESFVL